MAKTLSKQVRGAWAMSGVLRLGESRAEHKERARSELRAAGIGVTVSRISELTPISSLKTYHDYKAVTEDFARWAMDNGITRLSDLRPEHATSFLTAKLESGLSLNTMRSYAAALGKFDLVLATKKLGLPEEARLKAGVDAVRKSYNAIAERHDENTRAYLHPSKVVDALVSPEFQLVADLQLNSGLRVSEALGIRAKDLRGWAIDPLSGENCGVIHVYGKGGYERDVYVQDGTYQRLVMHGRIPRVGYKSYLRGIKKACRECGEVYTGSHSFRHNYVQALVNSLAEGGRMTADEVVREAMERVGHHRTTELGTYMR
ncbi:MAG: hypothetical protein Q8S17_02450 [Humidesulfovibrio sp.]|nr:hypothetical protein [Humidesulfovibrio sp.]